MIPAKELVASIAKDEECIVSANQFFPSIGKIVSDMKLQLLSGAEIYARPIVDQWAQIRSPTVCCHHKP